MANCADFNPNVYVPRPEKPWDRRRILHLYRRASLGAPLSTIDAASFKNPQQLVSELVNTAYNLPLTAKPIWANWTISNYSPDEDQRNTQIASQIIEWGTQWLVDIKNNGLRERMAFFWSNHFVTKIDAYYCPSWLYQYHLLLQKYALGNFKTFVSEIGKTPAMLVFLNNIQNTRFQINENYARELLELFTLGVDNGYTQADITNVAKAITGFNGIDQTNLCGEVAFVPFFWDPGQKTIFGKTGPWNYDDVINILFTERAVQISEFITRKIYKQLVNPEVNEEMIVHLASIFRASNFEIAPLLQAMLSSEHFFDDKSIGTIIPGHIEHFTTFMNEAGYRTEQELVYAVGYASSEFNQQIFSPTDVAGWPGNRTWINTASMPFRIENILTIMVYFYGKNGNQLEELRTLAKGLTQPLESNPKAVCNAIVNHLLPNGLQNESDYVDALAVFKGEVPENYFTLGLWNLDWEYAPAQILYLINHLANLPEFQLK
jgi:uncharacterized protein (DUF1800 family)